MRKRGIAESVRQYAADGNIIRARQAAEALGLSHEQSRSAIKSLRRQGQLARVGRGVYQFRAEPQTAGAPMNERIWRAMRINPRFTAADLARQAGTTTSYVYKRLRAYRSGAMVEQAGRKGSAGGGYEKQWRLTTRGKMHRLRPPVKPFTPDPEVLLAVRINRLVCTGAINALPEANDEAARLCERLLKRLAAIRKEKLCE